MSTRNLPFNKRDRSSSFFCPGVTVNGHRMNRTDTTTRPPFRQRLTSPQRYAEYERVRAYLDGRIPVIVEVGTLDTPPCSKEKFLVPGDLTAAHLSVALRRHVPISQTQCLYLYTSHTLLGPSEPMALIYERHASPDGFLYVAYATENTFG